MIDLRDLRENPERYRDSQRARGADVGLVDRIINNLPEAVHESTVVGRSNVHAGALTNGLESFENR